MTETDTTVWMRRLAALSSNDDALPDPALIWWQARLLDRQAARTRAIRPLIIAQWSSVVVAAAVLLALCVFYWPVIRDLVAPVATLTLGLGVSAIAALTVFAFRLTTR